MGYWENGNKKYEGEHSNSVYNGAGTEYDENGNKKYFGNFKGGLLHGAGEEYWTTGPNIGALKYRGEFANGLYHGEGTFWGEEKQKYLEGTFKNGKLNGAGK